MSQVTTWRYPNVADYWQRVLSWFDEHLNRYKEIARRSLDQEI